MKKMHLKIEKWGGGRASVRRQKVDQWNAAGGLPLKKIRRATYDKDGWSLLVYIDLVLI